MVRAKQAPPSSQRPTRSSGRVAEEVEVVDIEAADAPTQRLRSLRKNTRKTSQLPKTSNVAKKSALRPAPPKEPEEEVESEDEQT
jgi:hypothetical protein